MKSKRRLIFIAGSVLVLLSVVLVLTGIVSRPDADKVTELYISAAKALTGKNAQYETVITKTIHTGGNAITTTSTQSVILQETESEGFRGIVTESMEIGDYTIASIEQYENNTGYYTLTGTSFSGAITKEAYLARYAPVNLLDPNLYAEVNCRRSKGNYILTFSDASCCEGWLSDVPDGILSAGGTVKLSSKGRLVACSYTCDYLIGDCEITLHVNTEPVVSEKQPYILPIPENAVLLPDPFLPKQLEIVCGYLQATDSFRTEYTDVITCEAFGDTREQKITMSVSHDPDFSARVDSHIRLSNTGKLGADTVIDKQEQFHSGRYSISVNGASAAEDNNVDSSTMLTYCREIATGTILLPEYIQSATIDVRDEIIRIEFIGNQQFVSQLYGDACNALYQNPDIFKEQSYDERILHASFYIETDQQTGLPVSSGFSYEDEFKADGLPYILSYHATQQYTLTD